MKIHNSVRLAAKKRIKQAYLLENLKLFYSPLSKKNITKQTKQQLISDLHNLDLLFKNTYIEYNLHILSSGTYIFHLPYVCEFVADFIDVVFYDATIVSLLKIF